MFDDMNTAVVPQPATRWTSSRRFVIPVVAERLISGVLAVTITGAGIGLAFVPGLSLAIGVPIAAIGCLLGALLIRASERTIASTLVSLELDTVGLTLVRWNGARVHITRAEVIRCELGQWRSPSRPGIPVFATTLTIHCRDANHESTWQLMGPWRPPLDEVQRQVAAFLPPPADPPAQTSPSGEPRLTPGAIVG